MWLHSNATRNQQGGVHDSSELRYKWRNLYINSFLNYFTCSSVLVNVLRMSVGPGLNVNKITSLKSQRVCHMSFCAGLVEIEEGELTAQRLELQSQAVARTSFAKEPHVQQVSVLATPTPFPISLRGTTTTTLALLQPFRSAECSYYDQTASLSRPFPWQRTTSHQCSTCTSSTVEFFDPNRWNTYNYIKTGVCLRLNKKNACLYLL